MIDINGITWSIKLVPQFDPMLTRIDGSVSIGMCDRDTQTIYLNEKLRGRLLKKVICHELVHAAMFSYNVDLEESQEEELADIIATYGGEIISLTNVLFKKLKERSL